MSPPPSPSNSPPPSPLDKATLSGLILRVAKSRNLLETTKGAIPMTDPAFDGQAIRLRRKAALNAKPLLAQITPEVDGDSSSAESGPSPTKEVLVLFAPPGYFASRSIDVAEATQPAKFTEGTEANKKTVRFSDELITPASTNPSIFPDIRLRQKDRVIKPLPKRAQRQSSRIAAAPAQTSALTSQGSTSVNDSVESRRRRLKTSEYYQPHKTAPRRKAYCTLCASDVDLKAKWDFCFEKWVEHCESAAHVEKLRSTSAKASGAVIKASKGKGKGKAT
ncbi:hypothetical protein DFP72DRAFT_1108687 [Ephemerocybe angulata]|uniref:Uncharacterized protein n=1 Tax=Ephemerocybe angulata TaxID=980116 RepID=A0A8H6IJR2_9AGAR|nr:hypothetical protein DFP72DRAFT_1108687 [Tulosesus angulatus]